jgi:hypothetical protein
LSPRRSHGATAVEVGDLLEPAAASFGTSANIFESSSERSTRFGRAQRRHDRKSFHRRERRVLLGGHSSFDRGDATRVVYGKRRNSLEHTTRGSGSARALLLQEGM